MASVRGVGLGLGALASLAALGAGPVPAAAQLRSRDVLVTWYAGGLCDREAGPFTHVLVVQGVAQRVPNAERFPTYKVTCGADAASSGAIEYCNDIDGTDCPLVAPFTPGQCLPNDVSQYGSGSYSVTCPPAGVTETALPDLQVLAPSRFEINWFPAPGCGIPVGPNFDRSIVSGEQGICHRVPNSPIAAGYRVVCNSGGTEGVLQFCADAACGTCDVMLGFGHEQCIPNNAGLYGSGSYAVRCPQPGTPLPGLPGQGVKETVTQVATLTLEQLAAALPPFPAIPGLPSGLSNAQILSIVRTLPPETLASFLAQAPIDALLDFVRGLTQETALGLVNLLPVDTLRALLSALPSEALSTFLSLVPDEALPAFISSLTTEQALSLLQALSVELSKPGMVDLSPERVGALLAALPDELLLQALPLLQSQLDSLQGECPEGFVEMVDSSHGPKPASRLLSSRVLGGMDRRRRARARALQAAEEDGEAATMMPTLRKHSDENLFRAGQSGAAPNDASHELAQEEEEAVQQQPTPPTPMEQTEQEEEEEFKPITPVPRPVVETEREGGEDVATVGDILPSAETVAGVSEEVLDRVPEEEVPALLDSITLPVVVTIAIPAQPEAVRVSISEAGSVSISVVSPGLRSCVRVPSVPAPSLPPPAVAPVPMPDTPETPAAPVVVPVPVGPETPVQPGQPETPAAPPAASSLPQPGQPQPDTPAGPAPAPETPVAGGETAPSTPTAPVPESEAASPVAPPFVPLRGSIIAERPGDVRLTWFERADCNATFPPDSYSGLVLPETLCHVVPGSPRRGYQVFCNPDGSPNGIISFCEDSVCGECNVHQPFSDEQCIPVPAQFGSNSLQMQCNKPLIPPQSPLPGRALIAWFEFPECDTTHRTLVDITAGRCQTVPRGGADGVSNAGYKVDCDGDDSGSGAISFCAEDSCGNCGTPVRFAADQCLPNLPGLGSLSYAIRCPRTGGYEGDMMPATTPPTGPVVIPGQKPQEAGNDTLQSAGAAGVTLTGLAVAMLVAAVLRM